MMYAAIPWNSLVTPITPQADTSRSAFRAHNAADQLSEVAVYPQ